MATQNIGSLYSSWIEAVNDRKWDAALQVLASQIIYNDETTTNETVLHGLREVSDISKDKSITLDLTVVGSQGDKVAARLVHGATLTKPYQGASVTGNRVEWTEHMFCWFEQGKITKITSFSDLDTLRANNAEVVRTPPLEQREAPQGFDMAQAYRDYIHAINTLTMKEHFSKYCLPDLTHNDKRMTVDQYREFIESSFDDIKGLSFTILEIVVDEESQQLAARLEFGGRPVKEFAGIKPTGKEVKFWEHVYYKLDGGKIALVWALLDLEAFRKSIGH